jgi:membrane protease YdiL (CAAX protease family)
MINIVKYCNITHIIVKEEVEMVSYIKRKSMDFYRELLSSKFFIITLSLYIVIKIVSNLVIGANVFTALRSGILGALMYLLGYYAICLFSQDTKKEDSQFKLTKKVTKKGYIAILICFSFLFIRIVDSMQRQSHLAGKPILSYIPGYDWLVSAVTTLSENVAGLAEFIHPYQVYNIITGNIFYVIIPLIIFMLLGYRFKGLFTFKNSRASWPFIALYIVTVALKGINAALIWVVIYSILYPALCEEFFHRGIIVRTTCSSFKKIATGIIVGTLLFSLMHFPDTCFRMYDRDLLMTVSRMGNVLVYGLLLAYGFRKTGTILPWIIIHALTDTLTL